MEEIGEDERGIRSSSFVNGVVDPEEEETSVLRRESAFNILNPLGSYSNVWKGVFLLSSAIALWLDPMFFYIITVNEDKKCLLLDRKLGLVAVFLRCSIDFIHIIYVACRLLKVDEDAWKKARRYLLSCFFLIDILSILPLPQVLILITPAIKGSRVLVAMDLLKYFVISQFVPRILRLYPLYTRGKGAFGALAEAAWVKALLNLFLYMLASHVIGALWYFLAIERETKCWREACGNQPGCVSDAFICGVTLGNHTFLNDLCPISSSNTEQFDFGIYLYALESGIVKVTNFLQKFFHCFRWGIQNLSSCGQNLQTSVYIWENVFALFITISGLLSLLLLIGNVQIFLQAKTMRQENKRLKALEEKHRRVHKVKQWKPFEKLSSKFQKKIIENQECIPRDLDLEKLLQDLPQKLSTKIKKELCFDLLYKVPPFKLKGKRFLETLCYHVKPIVYSKGYIIIRKEERISSMLFIVQGELKIQGETQTKRLGDGDFFGEELQQWVFSGGSGNSLPKSNILVEALTMVEAFALESDDLERNWAAMVLQSLWQLRQHWQLRGIAKVAVERKEKRLRSRMLSGATDSKSSHAALAKWEPFKKLSGALQWKVKDYMLHKSQEITDVDLVMLLHKLPKKLSTQMKGELCFDLLNKDSIITEPMENLAVGSANNLPFERTISSNISSPNTYQVLPLAMFHKV
ncbi:hypothetical protein SLE2022_373850 [Rubroshorea leprosula]